MRKKGLKKAIGLSLRKKEKKSFVSNISHYEESSIANKSHKSERKMKL